MISMAHARVEKKPPINKIIKSKQVSRNIINSVQPNNKCNENKKCLDCSQDSSRNKSNTHNEKRIDCTSDCNENVIESNNSYPFEQLYMSVTDYKENNSNEKDEILTINKTVIPIEKIAIISSHNEYCNQLLAEEMKSTCNNSSAYDDIMNFLGTLEEPDYFETSFSRGDKDANAKITCDSMDSTIIKEELAIALFRLDDREETIKILKEELKNEKKIIGEKLEDEKKTFHHKLMSEKTKYENAIKRHQRLIEKLIGEKKKLSEKCHCLAEKIEEMDKKFQRNLKMSMEKQVIELERTREMCAASEKMRRERWLEAKTLKIKELTIKGLEPELRTMIEKHQEEIQQIKSIHMKELQEVELRTIRRSQQQLEQLRLELTESYDKLMANERESLRLRYEEKFNEQEALMEIQQRKYFQDVQKEKERFSDELLKKQVENEIAIQHISAEFQEKIEKLMEQNEVEKKNLKEAFQIEYDVWMKNLKQQQIMQYQMAEAKIRDECDRERDRQIELAIERLEKETRDMKINIERNTDNKLRCMREKYEDEIQTRQENETLAREKLTISQEKLEILQDEFKKMEDKLNKCLADCNNLHKYIEQLVKEKEDAKNLARQEIEYEKQDLHNEIASLNEQIAEINENRELHMTQLYSRIKLCVTQRDVIINRMTKEANEARKRCDYLERMLDQQRKEYVLQTL